MNDTKIGKNSQKCAMNDTKWPFLHFCCHCLIDYVKKNFFLKLFLKIHIFADFLKQS